jgi:hypothetical protein
MRPWLPAQKESRILPTPLKNKELEKRERKNKKKRERKNKKRRAMTWNMLNEKLENWKTGK